MSQAKKGSFVYRNSLSIAFIILFLLTMAAQAFFGWKEHNQDRNSLGATAISLSSYLLSGHFLAATFENFQSEFLQMTLYVILTIFLRQVGSAESKDPDKMEEVDRVPDPTKKDAPAPVWKGGWRLIVYQNSLSIAFILLFLVSWGMHLYGSFKEFNLQEVLRGRPEKSLSDFLAEPQFWFETFQNWQSEFLSVASIVILTIFLRQKGSPESKPVDAAYYETGK